MDNLSKKIKPITTLVQIAIIVVAIISGYVFGSVYSTKKFSNNVLSSQEIELLRNDISNISITNKAPSDFNGAIAFQLAERVLIESTNYEVVGIGTMDTSLGVKQSSATIDRRNGNDLYFAFTTYSSVVKTSRQASYHLGENVKMYHGTPNDETTTNVNWSNKFEEYSWEDYYKTFGKYANVNCSYIVSTETAISVSEFEIENDLYKCTIELDPQKGSSAYIKQIGANMGVDPATVKFHKILFTFYLTQDFKFVKIVKFESYTVPYFGINLTLDSKIDTLFTIN